MSDRDIEAERAANRARMPAVTGIVAEFESVFGKGQIRVLGGEDFQTGCKVGWVPPPSPNCDTCAGHDGRPGCDRMDRVSYGHDRPRPDAVFCGYRLRTGPAVQTFEKKGARR